jgi:hypothetical protein
MNLKEIARYTAVADQRLQSRRAIGGWRTNEEHRVTNTWLLVTFIVPKLS